MLAMVVNDNAEHLNARVARTFLSRASHAPTGSDSGGGHICSSSQVRNATRDGSISLRGG